MTDKKYAVITTFHQKGYEICGHKMISSFAQYWPKDVMLYAYWEEEEPRDQFDNVVYIDLLRSCPDLVAFRERNRSNKKDLSNPVATFIDDGVLFAQAGDGHKFAGIRCAYKNYCLFHASTVLDVDYIIWYDADIVTLEPVTHEFLDVLCPDWSMTSYLGREELPHEHHGGDTETGWVGYNARHPYFREFIDAYKEMYDQDKIYKQKYYYDCYIYDLVRRRIEKTYGVKNFDISKAHQVVSGHPFNDGPLGTKLDHLKGPDKQTQMTGTDQKYLIIHNRNAGFFSIFLQIVNTLLLLNGNEDIVPVVRLDRPFAYTSEPPAERWRARLKRLLPFMRSGSSQDNTTRFPGDPWHIFFKDLVPYGRGSLKASKSVFHTEAYYPREILGHFPDLDQHTSLPKFTAAPSQEERLVTSRVIGRFIELKREYRVAFDEYREQKFSGHYVIGVNYRGTDARADERRYVPTYEAYVEHIDRKIAQLDTDNYVIFATSDEQKFIEFLSSRYRVLSIDTVREKKSNDLAKQRFVNGLNAPMYIQADKTAALRGAIMDYYLLCHCNCLIYCMASIPLAAMLTNPNLEGIMVSSFRMVEEDIR